VLGWRPGGATVLHPASIADDTAAFSSAANLVQEAGGVVQDDDMAVARAGGWRAALVGALDAGIGGDGIGPRIGLGWVVNKGDLRACSACTSGGQGWDCGRLRQRNRFQGASRPAGCSHPPAPWPGPCWCPPRGKGCRRGSSGRHCHCCLHGPRQQPSSLSSTRLAPCVTS
jgi:hypothetical protein